MSSEYWNEDSLQWTFENPNSEGEGSLNFYLYPFSECSRDVAEGPISTAIRRAFSRMTEDPNVPEEYRPLNKVSCFSFPEYPQFDIGSAGDVQEEYDNIHDGFSQWRKNNIDETRFGVHLLLVDGHPWATASSMENTTVNGERTGFTTPFTASAGVGGNLDLAKNAALQESLHGLIDDENVPEIKEMLAADGTVPTDEHQLGSLRGGAVTPMATFYTGGLDFVEKYRSTPNKEINYGDCSAGPDEDWNGRYFPFFTPCTKKAVLMTRNSVLGVN